MASSRTLELWVAVRSKLDHELAARSKLDHWVAVRSKLDQEREKVLPSIATDMVLGNSRREVCSLRMQLLLSPHQPKHRHPHRPMLQSFLRWHQLLHQRRPLVGLQLLIERLPYLSNHSVKILGFRPFP